MQLDDWQKEILATEGNICLRSGRQVGKSTVVSMKAADYAAKHPKKHIMVISAVERQAYLLFEKILAHLHQYHRDKIKKGKDRPTKTKLQLTNGSIIYCLPTGASGYGIRGFTIDLLIADEAHYINEGVWKAVTPMLAMTGGDTWLLSTPRGREGYFYNCFQDESYTKFHISTEDVLNFPSRTELQKADLRKTIDHDKKHMTKLEYAQEYLGEFVDELMQFFNDDLIRKCMTQTKSCVLSKDLFLGVDVARMGGDETVLCSVERINRESIKMFDLDVSVNTMLTHTVRLILHKDRQYKFKKIYIDDGGLGVGVFDPLLEDDQTKRKVVAINNASRPLEADKKRNKKLLKEDLYNNLLNLMEQGKIDLLDQEEVFLSLKSIQMEYVDDKLGKRTLKIYGKYSHIAEALIRAAWCMKDKSLNIYIY